MDSLNEWHAHRHCVICGTQNPLGLNVRFAPIAKDLVEATWTVTERMQGYTGLLQGGVTSALLDSAMVNSLRFQGIEAFTAELNVRYIAPIPVGSRLTIRGIVLKSRKNLHWTEGTIHIGEQAVASASAKFMTRTETTTYG